MSVRLSVGMATFNDFEGVWATVQSIFLHNKWKDRDEVEVIIVDTSPNGSEHKRLVQGLVARHPQIKYVELPTVIGTTFPRDVIFQVATGPAVVVMDCHVMLPPNALFRLASWFEVNPNCQDLIHGPMWYDDLGEPVTHFANQFRGGMWGTWATMWQTPNGTYFTTEIEEVTDENKPRRATHTHTQYLDPFTLQPSDLSLPEIPWAGHNRELKKLGYFQPGESDSDIPFEIPGMGMGLFACRKDAWLGFAKHCSGFGGEEMNIHIKYEQAGRKTLCLPFLKWNHRFGRVGGAPYPLTQQAKVRNYVLWANELGNPIFKDHKTGKDITLLERIHNHFVHGGLFPQDQWTQLIADPLQFEVHLKLNSSPGMKPLDALFSEVANKPRDLNEHAESIRNLVYRTNSVVAFVKRGEWGPILASGYPKSLTVYQSEASPLTQRTHDAVSEQPVKDSRQLHEYNTHNKIVDPLLVDPLNPVDMLVIDKLMNGTYVEAVLDRHAAYVQKFILLRGTQAFGTQAEGDATQPGIFEAIKKFLKANPSWFVYYHKPNQYGYTVLSQDPTLLPEKEVRPWPLDYGPGTELKAILASVGINPSPNCSCRARMIQMDEWGIDGCEEHFDTIVGWLKEKADDWGWTSVIAAKADGPDDKKFSLGEKLAIGWKAISTGLAFKVNWSNPYPDLVRAAIERAKK